MSNWFLLEEGRGLLPFWWLGAHRGLLASCLESTRCTARAGVMLWP